MICKFCNQTMTNITGIQERISGSVKYYECNQCLSRVETSPLFTFWEQPKVSICELFDGLAEQFEDCMFSCTPNLKLRDIKFRAKDINEDKWRYGGYCKLIEIGDNGGMEHMYKETSTTLHYIIDGNGQHYIIQPNTLGEYVECLDAYEGDYLYGDELDEYGSTISSWKGLIRYNDDKGKIMIFDTDVDEWFEIDDFMFDIVYSLEGDK